jgi:hypothetical protein
MRRQQPSGIDVGDVADIRAVRELTVVPLVVLCSMTGSLGFQQGGLCSGSDPGKLFINEAAKVEANRLIGIFFYPLKYGPRTDIAVITGDGGSHRPCAPRTLPVISVSQARHSDSNEGGGEQYTSLSTKRHHCQDWYNSSSRFIDPGERGSRFFKSESERCRKSSGNLVEAGIGAGICVVPMMLLPSV